MKFKLILAFVDDAITDSVLDAARDAGATGVTVINNARGEGVKKQTTFLGLQLEVQRDVLLFLVESHLAKTIMAAIAKTAGFDDHPGQGIAVQLDVEQTVGLLHQSEELLKIVKEGGQ